MDFPMGFGFAIGLAIGALVGWLLAMRRANLLQTESAGLAAQLGEIRSQRDSNKSEIDRLRKDLAAEQTARTREESDAKNQRENLEEQRRLLDAAETKLKDAFNSLAGQALNENNQQFLRLAGTSFETIREEATGDLEKRKTAIDGLVQPLKEVLNKLEGKLDLMENSRTSSYTELRTQVQGLLDTGEVLRQETGNLVNVLRQPQVKGRWGELTLRRAVELAGMSPYCDFREQVTQETDEGNKLRPDLVVNLPGNSSIVVDSKVPFEGFYKIATAKSESERREGLSDHARLVRDHVSQLSSKEYWKQFELAPKFVVMFLPSEAFFSAALEQDPTLLEDSAKKRVLLASPTNLIALLSAVAASWRQDQIAKSAQEISEVGHELYERLIKFFEHLSILRSGLERANGAFNSAVGSLEGRVLPSARKLREKNVHQDELPSVGPTETSLRAMNTALFEPDK